MLSAIQAQRHWSQNEVVQLRDHHDALQPLIHQSCCAWCVWHHVAVLCMVIFEPTHILITAVHDVVLMLLCLTVHHWNILCTLLVYIQIYYILFLNLTNHVNNHIIRLPDYGIYYIALYYVGLYCTVLYFIVIVLYLIVLYCIDCIVLYCTVLYCTVLYCTVLYCTVLYCTVLYCIVLYCIVLYCVVLHYITLQYIILWHIYTAVCHTCLQAVGEASVWMRSGIRPWISFWLS